MRKELQTFFTDFSFKCSKIFGSSFTMEDLNKALKNKQLKYIDNKVYLRDETIDFPWLSEFEMITNKILAISKNPRTHIRVYKDVVNSEAAVKIDNNDLIETIKTPKFWKLNDDEEYRPEYVYTDTYETDIAIYENRFICHLVDKMNMALSNAINYVLRHVRYINKNYMHNYIPPSDIRDIIHKANFTSFYYSRKEILYRAKEEANIPLLTLTDARFVPLLRRLLNAKRNLTHIISTVFYKTVKKAKVVLESEIRPTNLLMGDKLYAPCFRFYFKLKRIKPAKDFINKIDVLCFRDYITLDLLTTLEDMGFIFNDKVRIPFKNKHIDINNLTVERKDKIQCTINAKSEDLIDVLFTLGTPDMFNEDYYINKKLLNKVAINLRTSEPRDDFSLAALEKAYRLTINNQIRSTYTNAFIVTPSIAIQNEDIVVASPYERLMGAHIKNLLRGCSLLIEGDSFLYKRICPICGARVDGETEDGNVYCVNCRSVYTTLSTGSDKKKKEFVWIKRLKNPLE